MEMNFKIMILIILLIFIGFVTFILLLDPIGSNYYVAMNGDDNNSGTEAHPWRTISKAANAVVAGDIVYVCKGIYNEKITIKNSGSPGKYITFAAYPEHSVTIDGTGISLPKWLGLINIRGKNYIRISGFRIVNSQWAGIFVADLSSYDNS